MSGAVFLSYASQDADAAQRIAEALRAAGVEVWFDQNELTGGDAWDAKIRKQIKACALFVPLISANTQARLEGYFRREWKLAVERTHDMADGVPFLFPVVIDDTPDATAHVPERFRDVQWTRVRLEQTPSELADEISKLLQRRSVPGFFAAPAGSPVREQASERRPRWWLIFPIFGMVMALIQMINRPWVRSGSDATETGGNPAPAVRAESQNERSLAVLPFANLSADRENEYFSDGIAEELGSVLAAMPELQVAARTSAFAFKGATMPAAELGTRLGVTYLVDGSVRKAEETVRVVVRLTRAATGEQIWSGTYDRGLADVFAIQTEIARSVADQVHGRISGQAGAAPAEVRERGGTQVAAAHEQYLQGLYYMYQYSGDTLARPIPYLQRAVGLDPQYAKAWAVLSRAYSVLGQYSPSTEGITENFALARRAADRALEIEPDLAEGHAARMQVQYAYDFDWRGAARSLREARRLAPGSADILASAIRLAQVFDRTDEGIALARQALARDPLNGEVRTMLAGLYSSSGRFAEAEAEYRKVLAVAPADMHAQLALNLSAQGRHDEAIAEARLEPGEAGRLWALAIAAWGKGERDEADASLKRLTELYAEAGAFQIAGVYAFRGEPDQAFAWLERAYRQRDGGLSLLRGNRWLRPLHGDPRWAPFLQKVGLADEPQE